MKIYVGFGEKRKEKFEAGATTFESFSGEAIAAWAHNNPDPESGLRLTNEQKRRNTDLGWINLQDISGWYKLDKDNAGKCDDELVGYVAEGNIRALETYIQTYPKGPEEAKEYLRNIRFDSDAMATLNYKDFSGWNLLNAAAFAGQAKMVEFLVDGVGMDINTPSYGVVPTFCCFPSMHNHLEDINFRRENLDAAKVFMGYGGDLSIQCSAGSTPSQLAVIHVASHIKDDTLRAEALTLVTESMINHGVDCNLTDNSGYNSLHHLCSAQKDKSLSELESQIRILVENGVDPRQAAKGGKKPVDCLDKTASKILFQNLIDSLRPEITSDRCIT